MAKHEIIIHENTSATSTTAPFLGKYQSKGTIDLVDKYEEMASLCGLPKIQVQTILEGAFAAIQDMEKAELVRIYTDLGEICGKIGGSFSSADAAFDATKNTFDLVLHLADDVKLDLVDVTPSIVTDETVTRVSINNVMDKEVNKPLNLIHGRHTFRVAGYNLVMTDTDAECYLLDSAGVKYACTVTNSISNQLFEAHSNDLLPGGDYKFVVKSRGGDSEGPLQATYRAVKYLNVPDAKLLETSDGTLYLDTFKDGESSTEFTLGSPWIGIGHYDQTAGDDHFSIGDIKLVIGSDEYATLSWAVDEDVTTLHVNDSGTTPRPAAGTYTNAKIRFTCTKSFAEAEEYDVPLAKLTIGS